MIHYQPNRGGLEQILRSTELRRFMAAQGTTAEQIARANSSTPGAISSQTTFAFNRWCVNVINNAPDAVRQEYGTRTQRALHPLGLVLAHFWANDPNSSRRPQW